MQPESERGTRERLLSAGAALFAENGFGGVSVREICQRAKTSSNMVHHYFESKAGLLDAIIKQFGVHVVALPLRLLEPPARSPEDFQARIEMLFGATLDAFMAERDVMMVVAQEQADVPALVEYFEQFTQFLENGKESGFVRAGLDTEMITGAILDRIRNQVQFAPWMRRNFGIDIADSEYRKRWCASNVDLLLHGLVP
ncbi:MAG: AcrR family transcriptional regulator [Bradymonadia bacterium]|jgi:AcrR family transcriptional regulator